MAHFKRLIKLRKVVVMAGNSCSRGRVPFCVQNRVRLLEKVG